MLAEAALLLVGGEPVLLGVLWRIILAGVVVDVVVDVVVVVVAEPARVDGGGGGALKSGDGEPLAEDMVEDCPEFGLDRAILPLVLLRD